MRASRAACAETARPWEATPLNTRVSVSLPKPPEHDVEQRASRRGPAGSSVTADASRVHGDIVVVEVCFCRPRLEALNSDLQRIDAGDGPSGGRLGDLSAVDINVQGGRG